LLFIHDRARKIALNQADEFSRLIQDGAAAVAYGAIAYE
jgi:hypothetical protein